MPTILQLRRGTDSQNNGFIGAAGELTFDASNNTIRAHDGTTLGGHRLATINDLSAVGVDSSQVANIVDSAYIQARQADIFRDSNFITQIVDSAYIQLRDRLRDSSFITEIVDSAFVQARQTLSTYGDSDVIVLVDSAYINARTSGLDSEAISAFIDSAYIQNRQLDIFRDSAFIVNIVDSAYVAQRAGDALDSAKIVDIITTSVTSTYITGLNVSADSLDGLDGTAFVRADVSDTKTGDLTFDDDASLKLGTGGNIELVYESGTGNAVIKKNTSGDMLIQADVLNLTSRSGEQYINMVSNAGVNIKYNNSTKLKTINAGVEVVGGVLPQFNGFYSLGSPSKRWKDVWVSGTTIYLGNLLMSADSSGGLRLATIDSDGTVTQEQGKVDPKNLDNAFSASLDSTSQQVLDTFDRSLYRTARYIIQMEQDSSSKYHSTEILLMHDDTNVYMTEYAVLRTDSALGDITADLIGDTVRLLITPSFNNTSIKAKRLIIDA